MDHRGSGLVVDSSLITVASVYSVIICTRTRGCQQCMQYTYHPTLHVADTYLQSGAHEPSAAHALLLQYKYQAAHALLASPSRKHALDILLDILADLIHSN